jgi:hypothetical protein
MLGKFYPDSAGASSILVAQYKTAHEQPDNGTTINKTNKTCSR